MTPIFKDVKSNFWLFATLFSINRAAATIQLTFATPLLGLKIGSHLSVVFLYTCMVGCLFLGPLATGLWRARQTMMLGSILFALSVWVFVAAVTGLDGVVDRNANGAISDVQHALAILAGLLGGLGAGFVWSPWGAYLTCTCDALHKEGIPREQITAKLTSEFAVVYLVADLACSILSSVLKLGDGIPDAWLFIVFAVITTLTSVVFAFTHDLSTKSDSSSRCIEATSAVQLWPDARLWLFLLTTITFGFGASFLNGIVNNEVKESTQLGKASIGFLDGFSTMVATVIAYVCGFIADKISLGQLVGISVGAVSFLLVAVFDLSVYFNNKKLRDVGYLLILPYLFQGIGRGAYESVNKAVFVDHFPHNQVGASSNQMVFCTISMGAFFLFTSSDAQVPSSVTSGLIGILALFVVPCYLLGTHLSRTREAKNSDDDEAARMDDTDSTKSDGDVIEKGTAPKESMVGIIES
eukprot:GEMP01024104.1.p1 GENE.GEMP01024104.1~~GEMP01024104.1.p1  ORF type:complete len:468 (+),score=83.95 GEMP01024104.1:145-1548(+)